MADEIKSEAQEKIPSPQEFTNDPLDYAFGDSNAEQAATVFLEIAKADGNWKDVPPQRFDSFIEGLRQKYEECQAAGKLFHSDIGLGQSFFNHQEMIDAGREFLVKNGLLKKEPFLILNGVDSGKVKAYRVLPEMVKAMKKQQENYQDLAQRLTASKPTGTPVKV